MKYPTPIFCLWPGLPASRTIAATRNSLVNAFQTERIIREHQDFIDRRYELFAHLENNLTALMTFEVNNQANEYGQLLNEALQIGMSVHRESEIKAKLKTNLSSSYSPEGEDFSWGIRQIPCTPIAKIDSPNKTPTSSVKQLI